jgi:rhodanese-related sulfurtransferase
MRTRVAVASLLLALALPWVAGSAAQNPDAIDAPRISQAQFKKLVAAKNVVIVDTRTADSFAANHIPGALLLPLEGVMTWPESYEPTVTKLIASRKPVVTYCA